MPGPAKNAARKLAIRESKAISSGVIDHARVYSRLSLIEHWLERAVTIPVIGKRFGLDALIGLVPGVGDLIAGGIGGYILYEAWRLGMPKSTLATMAGRLLMDTGIGSIPLVGDLWDLLYASNSRNLKDVKAHLETLGHGQRLETEPTVSRAWRPS
jgi:Domain of unknown function (DUF4112)